MKISIKTLSIVIAGAILLAISGCGGGTDSSSSSSGSSSAASVGTSCNYADVISSSTRSNALADVQCSSYVANADASLSAARANCAAGDPVSADKIYNQYLLIAKSATASVSLLCPGSTPGPTLPGGNSNGANFNLFILYSSVGKITSGTCTTNSSPPAGVSAGSTYQLKGSGMTQSECLSLASSYGLS